MNDKDYRARLDEALLGDCPISALRQFCKELIAEVNRLNQVIELNNATMRDAF